MTADQAEDYPKAPDSGAVELDAMEELSPGRLGAIVWENAAQFRDADLARKVHQNAREAQEVVDEAVRDAIADELDGVEEVKDEAEGIYERYRTRLRDLAAALDDELSPLDERLETLQQASHQRKARRPQARLTATPRAGGEPEGRGLALR
jgi:acetyl-CoA carboxylase alpha subunit